MSKYIATWTETGSHLNPFYNKNSANREPKYLVSTTQCHKYLSTDRDLEEFVLSALSSNKKNIRYFILGNEVYPTLQVSMQLNTLEQLAESA